MLAALPIDFHVVTTWFLHHAFRLAFILLTGLIAQEILRFISGRLHRSFSKSGEGTARNRAIRAKSLTNVFFTSLSVVVWLVVVLALLEQFGVNIGPFLASAGIIGLAISFGSQELIKDVITGLFMLLENQFNTGDIVQIQDKKGKVKDMSLRTVTLQDIDSGAVYIVRNSQIGIVTRFSEKDEVVHTSKEGKADA